MFKYNNYKYNVQSMINMIIDNSTFLIIIIFPIF